MASNRGARAQWRRVFLLCAFASLRLSALLGAQRDPVFKQIAVPHSYYYREMYLPQVTSGPSAAAWSPDGTELVYSMQGSLWRQRIGEREAVQLTDGPGYDYQPDWSPDGRHVVYSSYRNDAMELWLLDLRDGSTRALVANGAVNLDPRWSPDGSRIAFVSTAHEGRFHVFLCAVAPLRPCTSERITADTLSALPRYYYSRWDHYLSPVWSPDGNELLVVSNRGHTWGSGGIWRIDARAGGGMREIRREETNWKARPDWSPDGRRVVYSSYIGGQRHQLWLTTSDGGDPFQLGYCACDETVPRWSPDGRRIAFISNRDGNTSLRVVTIPGGAVTTITAATRRYLVPRGTLRLAATDAAGVPLPVRYSVTGADGRGWAPDGAWRHADDAFERSRRRFEATYFHAAGPVTLSLPSGSYTVEAFRGLEYMPVTRQVTVVAETARTERLVMSRLLDLPARGWWSGDLHVHMNYGGAYRADPARLKAQAEAEDLHVVENLIVNKEQRIPDVQYFRGGPDPVSTPRTIITHDEEYHTSYWGHSAQLGMTSHLLLPNYAGYANTAAASLFPDNATIAAAARGQRALFGYVHPFDPPAPDPAAADPLTNSLPVDVALGLVDYIEVMGFSDHLTTAGVWYRLLNTGFRIPAGAGTDAMTNFASLRGPVGMNRVFVRSGVRLDYRGWLAALRAGKTFVSNGPLLTFTLNGRGPGEELNFSDGVHQLVARVSLRSMVAVERLEIVANGVVLAPIPLDSAGTKADVTVPLPVTRSGWYTLRAVSSKPAPQVYDAYPYATTSPVYVTVGGRPLRHAEDARYFVRWIARLEAAAGLHQGWNDAREKTEVLERLARARNVFEERARLPVREAGGSRPP
jgi:hypothetical protein